MDTDFCLSPSDAVDPSQDAQNKLVLGRGLPTSLFFFAQLLFLLPQMVRRGFEKNLWRAHLWASGWPMNRRATVAGHHGSISILYAAHLWANGSR